MNYASPMKAQIVADLESLVTTGTLGAVIQDEMIKAHPLDREFPSFPAALVIPPAINTSDYEDQATNLREYTWYIMVVIQPEKVKDTTLEDLMDAVLNVFDQDVTLGGTAIGGILPAIVEPPGPISFNDTTYVVFYVTFKARQIVAAAVKQ